MKKYEENYADLLEKKSLKEAEVLREEMKALKHTITEMELVLSLKFDASENDEVFLEIFNLMK
jgi:hypothetical protein